MLTHPRPQVGEYQHNGLQCFDHFLEDWPIDEDCPCIEAMVRRRRFRVVK